MKRFVIAIEETLVQNFEVKANTSADAMEIAERKYKDGEFVLTSDEVTLKQMAIITPSTESTEWVEF